jgi:hypothetical protein
MKCFKITKHFQGGQSTYYAEMSDKKTMRKGCWQYQLEQWGECTNGGHNYGYRIDSNRCKRPKRISKRLKLRFNKYYLEKK